MELKGAIVSKRLLEQSKLGVEVNKLRKSATGNIAKLATEILLEWREIMLEKPNITKRSIKVKEGDEEEDKEGDKEKANGAIPPQESKETKGSMENIKRIRQDSLPATAKEMMQGHLTGDPIRDKCFEMLLTALSIDSIDEPDELILSICRNIEECLFKEFEGVTDQQYKAKFRSRYLNLKDKQNANLRKSLLTGYLSPISFCAMSTAELASEERRVADALMVETNLREAKAAQDTEAETDQFKCGRCKQRRTKYYQLQTRSADEPMTTFVTCINCGNRWKFC